MLRLNSLHLYLFRSAIPEEASQIIEFGTTPEEAFSSPVSCMPIKREVVMRKTELL